MANAKREEVIVRSEGVTLTLTEDEAKALTAVLARIGGLGEVRDLLSNNPDSIYYALEREVGRWTLGGETDPQNWWVSEDTTLVRF